MSDARHGSTVAVHYTGRLANGTVFDSSRDRDPLQFTIGEGSLIKGFEQAVVGMTLGDSITVTLDAADAYGQHHPEMLIEVPREQLPPDMTPEIGDRLEARDRKGNAIPLVITGVGESSVTLDGNHPLAGQQLTFEIELVSVSA